MTALKPVKRGAIEGLTRHDISTVAAELNLALNHQ
jgi:hypothetical protein